MRRAAVSIASNIAEGCERRTERDLVRYLRIAYGSACELETQALIALDARLASLDEVRRLTGRTETVRRMLSCLITSIEADTDPRDRGR